MTPRVPYAPGLDGLRALAVIAVLVYHHDTRLLPGGFFGVSLFFTLSGFLITRLLLVERDASGTTHLGAFWARRLRRLLPASVLALLLALVVTVVAVPGGQQARVLGDIRAAALNIANWHFIVADLPYGDLDLTGSPVRHYWSLAIEEQFYLVFPLLAAATLRRRGWFPAALVLVIIASLVQQLRLDELGRVYEGSDTRAGELAVGALLAVGYPHIRSALTGRLADILGLTGIAGFAVLALAVPLGTEALASGGLLAVSTLWVVLLLGAMDGPRTRRHLSATALVELGRRSYGVYLFHLPLYVLLTEERTGLDGPALLLVRVLATLAVAAASYQLLEVPIRYSWRPRPRLAPAVAGFALTAVIVASVAMAPPPAPEFEVLAQAGAPAADEGPPTTDGPATPEPVTETVPTAPPATGGPVSAPASQATEPAPPPPTSAPARAPRVLVVGDSTSRFMGQGLQAWGRETGLLDTSLLNGSGCVVLRGERARHRDGLVVDPPCGDVMAAATEEAARTRPDAVVVLIGSFQLLDWSYADMEGFHTIIEPLIQQRYLAALADDLDALVALGIPVLWADVPPPDFDIDRFSEATFGTPWPGSGPPTMNDPTRHAALAALDQPTIARYAMAEQWPFTAAISEPDGTISEDVRPDGLHMEPDAAQRLGPELDAAMRGAYRAIVDRTGIQATPSRWTG